MDKEVKKESQLNDKHFKTLVTSRVLFISVLDKIFLVILLLMLISGSISIFSGDISSLNYGFWSRVFQEAIFLVCMFITYLLFNWIYKCAAKTMLCLTKDEVYKEHYVPFKSGEISIPLNRITRVSTLNVFWIFRSIIIFQYGRFPLIFFTWNNQEFKDKLNELLTGRKLRIENEYQNRNIITEDKYSYLKYFLLGIGLIILLVGIVRFFSYTFGTEKKLVGTYKYEKYKIVLMNDGTCNIDDIEDRVTECSWNYNKEDKEVNINYRYKSYYGYGTASSTIDFMYDSKKETLKYRDRIFKK